MTTFILDTYAWVEYFLGSPKGEQVRKLFLVAENNFLTITPCLGELHAWALRNRFDFALQHKVVRANSDIVNLSEEEWIEAGAVRHTERKRIQNFGMIDSCIIVKQEDRQCTIVSGDIHFLGKKKVIYLG